jgi:membrane-bound lytic murein transglycosylase D
MLCLNVIENNESSIAISFFSKSVKNEEKILKIVKNYLTFIILGIFTASCASFNSNQSTLPPDSYKIVPKQKKTISSQSHEQKDKKAKKTTTSYTRNSNAFSFDTDYLTIKDSESTTPKIGTFLDDALEFCQTAQDFWQKGELENALDALDQAYDLIIKVDTYDKPILTQQKDDLRFMISKRILEIYASRNIVINGNYNEIPLTLNEHVQYEIDLLTTGGEKNFFIESYKRSGLYRPMIVEALKNAGLPEELSWLPLIESGFKVNALSSARALGLWQFIPSTGYKFGLKRDIFIDERLDFEKSTEAAIAYLKELHQIFGDWSTVLAAYNCGEGRVLRVIRTQNVNYLDNFWDLYSRLPRETARYVPRFLATLHIINNLEKYGFDTIVLFPPLEYETVTISQESHIKSVAEAIEVSEITLKSLNPELRNDILPSEEYKLRVPIGKSETFMAKINSIPIYSPPPSSPQPSKEIRSVSTRHRVRQGETLSLIANKYGISIDTIANANKINKKNLIVSGQTLKIPSKNTTKTNSKTYQKSIPKPVIDHVVRAGDSLWVLARKYGTTTEKIKESNKLKSSTLFIGQTLKIEGYSSASANKAGQIAKYKVAQGDTPFSIAQRHKMKVERFLQINQLHSNSKIFPGQSYHVE